MFTFYVDHSAEPKTKSKRRKLFKKSEISAPFSESPVPLQVQYIPDILKKNRVCFLPLLS